MNIPYVRYLVAAGAAALVMGLGGNLYATSYPMPKSFGFGAGPTWGFETIEAKVDFLSDNHGAYQRAAHAFVLDRLGRIAAKEEKRAKFDRKKDKTQSPGGSPTVFAAVESTGTPTMVPDGGATLLMLGGALCGLAVLRRGSRV